MSDCCDNPGVGVAVLPKGNGVPHGLEDPDYAAYNPGEVRLYGRPALCRPIFTINDEEIDKKLEEALSSKTAEGTNNKELAVAAREVFVNHMAESIIGAAGEKITLALFHGFEVCSLPVNLSIKDICCRDEYMKSIGVIYGYAYEGHCYKLPKPQIMFLPSDPRNIVIGDCGCDCGYDAGLGYAVWQIDKLKPVIALDIRSDDLKTLVLDENLPGNRSPMAYAQTMALAPQRHRD